LAGFANANQYLLAAKWLAALGALATTADCCAIFNWTRVHNTGIIKSAEWAIHLGVSSNQCSIFATSGVRGFFERNRNITLKPLLMEANLALTPTSCVNYKALVEDLPVE
jgi:hypothetical protein